MSVALHKNRHLPRLLILHGQQLRVVAALADLTVDRDSVSSTKAFHLQACGIWLVTTMSPPLAPPGGLPTHSERSPGAVEIPPRTLA